jgi:aldehyde dehydrogenase (NAD+)
VAATTPFEYAPAPESREIARLRPSYGIFVNGAFRDGSGDVVSTIDPSTGTSLAEVAEAGPDDVDAAVAAARHAYDSVW